MDKRCRWWAGFTLALFLLVPLDMFTTMLSVAQHGLGVEANPFVRYLLYRGVVELTLVNLFVVGVSVYAFHVAVETIRDASGLRGTVLELGVDAWLVVLMVGGTLVAVNNVATVL
jgi:hypothetical protein